jgi:Tfp pilus assembly major pilin PilA/Zn-dependent protease with chaperone function
MNLVYKHEKPLFIISAIVSTIAWLALIGGTFGAVLFYILIVYLFILFSHSAFISHLKGSGVKITAEQFPDLHVRLLDCCARVGLQKIPDAYLLRTGFFNALATRFLGKNFVVVFTEVIDALESHPDALNFYIGHELGHLHRKHINWNAFLLPASILPLLGASLRRAEEYTCDRYGVVCCDTEESIKYAIAALAAGDSRWNYMNADAYTKQISMTSEFWMSFNELTGDYPWLTKRMASALALKRAQDIKHPRRHLFAWFLAIFTPRFGMGGGLSSVIIVVAIIGILAAVALPAYQDYTKRAHYMSAYKNAQEVRRKVDSYVGANQAVPTDLKDLGYAGEIYDQKGKFSIELIGGDTESSLSIVATFETAMGDSEGKIYLNAEAQGARVDWSCTGEDILEKYLPKECR